MVGDILQNVSLFVDGRGYAGLASEITLPKLTPVLQEYKAGGMSAAVDVPMAAHEKLEAEVTLKAFDPEVLKLFNIAQGNQVPFSVRGAFQDDEGNVHGVTVTMQGLIKELDMGTWKPGEETTLKMGLSLRYYKLERDGEVLIEADPVNLVFKVGGVDQQAAIRDALGL